MTYSPPYDAAPDEPEGYGPVMYDDDGRAYRITEEEARNALGPTGGALLFMAAWDFGAHDQWLLSDGTHLYVAPWMRTLVRVLGLALFAAICLVAARDAKAAEDARARQRDERLDGVDPSDSASPPASPQAPRVGPADVEANP